MSFWKRPKEIGGQTEKIATNEGSLFFTKNYDNGRLREIRGVISKGGTLGMVMVDTFCKLISIILQSPIPKYKIIKKFKKQFTDMNVGIDKFKHNEKEYSWTVDFIIKDVIEELEK